MLAIARASIDHYKTLGRAIKFTSKNLEAIVTLDVGPRIMHVSLPGGPNMFLDECDLKETLPDGSVYEFFGGHRVWHSPEAFPRSYSSDSHPLNNYELFDDGILMVQAEEPWTHIVKSVELRFSESSIRVKSSLKNNGAWPIDMAVWSLLVGSLGGREVLPVVQRNSGLLPNTFYVSWPYSRMNDPRVYWGQRFVVVDQDPNKDTPFKLGYPNEYGWMAYFNNGCCFIKKYRHDRHAVYPDMGSSWETHSAGWGIDIESLSPLQTVQPGAAISHEEEWFVFECPRQPAIDEDLIARTLEPFAKNAGITLPVVSTEAWDPTFVPSE